METLSFSDVKGFLCYRKPIVYANLIGDSTATVVSDTVDSDLHRDSFLVRLSLRTPILISEHFKASVKTLSTIRDAL